MLTEALILCGVPRLANKVKFYICYFVLFPPLFNRIITLPILASQTSSLLRSWWRNADLHDLWWLASWPPSVSWQRLSCSVPWPPASSTSSAGGSLRGKEVRGKSWTIFPHCLCHFQALLTLTGCVFCVVVTESCLNCSLMLLYLTHLLSALNARSNRKHPFNCLTLNIS